MRRLTALGLAACATLAACDRSMGGKGTASAPDSVAILSQQLAEARTVAAQQDSLMQGFTASTKLLEDIDAELSKVKGLHAHVPLDVKQGDAAKDPQTAYRASLLGKVQEVTKLLTQSRARVASLKAQNGELGGKVAQYEQTIASLEGLVESQKQQIAVLTGQVDSLTSANTTLASEKTAVTDTLTTVRKEANTVYYVVGTKDDLIKRGIVVEEGSKFLFFGHKVLVPARHLDPSAFTAMNKWEDTPITLPSADRRFRIVSRHDAALLTQEKDSAGKADGALHVQQPSEFWSTSKFLIIVEG